jgi:quinol monooxygenase YgiN
MRFIQAILMGLAMLATTPASDVRAQGTDAFYVVTYIEVMPSTARQTATLLREYAEASRRQDGNLRLELLQRIDRPSHFAVLAAWKDQKAFDAHAAAASTKQFRDKLAPHLSSGYDERPHGGLSVGDIKADGGKTAVFAVTHVDFIPPKKDDGIAASKTLADATRKGEKPARFEILQQSSRPNHLTFVEIWPSQKAIEAHWVTDATKKFRADTLPMSGSLYDERLYHALK